VNFKTNIVSILIPTYNREKIILETLNCAVNQTYKNTGGSTGRLIKPGMTGIRNPEGIVGVSLLANLLIQHSKPNIQHCL